MSRRPLGPLAEREFRLLFLGRTISFLGSAIALVAVAFGVLEIGSTADLGLVVAARMVPQLVFLLVGGVWADRLPRHLVMVATNVISGAAQAVTAGLLIAGAAHVWQLALLQAVAGVSAAFFFPASTGIVPQTVSRAQLQQANALLRLSLNATQITGSAVAGLLVAAAGPGPALAVDASAFLVSAVFLAAMRFPRLEPMEARNLVRELREGWGEFRSRTWLWVIVVAFGFINALDAGAINVLGPVVARDELGGAAAWGAILTAQSIGFVVAGLVALRIQPQRILFVGCLGVLASAPQFGLLAVAAAVPLIAAGAFVAGLGEETFGVYWDTALQQEIPQERLSRVSSYDALGSFVFIPVGAAAAGPVAAAIGIRPALWGAGALVALFSLAMLATPDVRRVRRRGEVGSPDAATA